MKKSKIILSAMGLLCIIAGAFAFKAQHKFIGMYVCYTGDKVKSFATSYTTFPNGFTTLCTLFGGGVANATTLKVTILL